jgi:hypothetical protein
MREVDEMLDLRVMLDSLYSFRGGICWLSLRLLNLEVG